MILVLALFITFGLYAMVNREQMHVVKTIMLTETATSTGTVTSAAVDTQGFDALTVNLHYGATAPAPTSYKLTECDTVGGTYTDVAAGDIIDDGGTHAVSTTRKIAYIGGKRFVKAVVVQSASTILGISATLGYPSVAPTSNPA